MKQRLSRSIRVLAVLAACASLSCDSLGGLAAFFGGGITVVIENDTGYLAIPEIRTSDSKNIFEDIFNQGELVTSFGIDGTVLANQTVTFILACDGDLELIAIGDTEFRDGGGFAVGDVNANVRLRRDSDFDCGDTVHIRLSGGLFNFDADVDVERAPSTQDSGRQSDGDDSEDDIAEFLDDLFG
ncbi:MAG: hypothetical protein ABII12_14095 [Planctomycetota bacterium]